MNQGYRTNALIRRHARRHQREESRTVQTIGALLSILGAVACAFAGVLIADYITDAGYVAEMLAAIGGAR